MDDFSEYSSDVVDFPSTWDIEKSKKLVNASCFTDPLPPMKSEISQTNSKLSVAVSKLKNLKISYHLDVI